MKIRKYTHFIFLPEGQKFIAKSLKEAKDIRRAFSGFKGVKIRKIQYPRR